MPEETTTVETTVSANVERSAELAAEHAGKQKLLSDKFIATVKREESDRIAGWYVMAVIAYEYVSADLDFLGNGVKTFQASVAKLTAFLADYSDDAKASISRLLATRGLYLLMADGYKDEFGEEAEASELCQENMEGLTVSLLKSLVRLVVRDESAPGLRYIWKTEAIEKGYKLVSDAYGDGYTVAQCRDAVDKLLAPPVSEDDAEETAGSVRKRESQKAVKSIDKALGAAEKNGARKESLTRAVTTKAFSIDDIASILAAVSLDDIPDLVGVLATRKRFKLIGSLMKASLAEIEKLKASQATTVTVNGAAVAQLN